MKRPIVIFCVLAAICLVVLPFWALQSKGGADASPESSVASADQQGLEIFQINCGACHTMEAAGTDGKIGPDLDQLLATGPKSPETVKGNQTLVYQTVQNGIGGRMPKDLVQGEQARQVAQFVAENLAYVPGQTTPTASSP
jgi:mono/diheme cytochrome c family protein